MTPRLQVDLTENGMAMLKNFLMDICSFSGDFTMEDRQKECIQYIKEMVGDNKVLVSVTVVTKRSFHSSKPLIALFISPVADATLRWRGFHRVRRSAQQGLE